MDAVVAMSGGVDSSVAAALLSSEGLTVTGLSMQLYDQSDAQDSFGSCCSIDDLHDARRVAHRLGIPHYILNFEREFHREVVTPFADEYSAGRTPIPCARCNSNLKFSTLLERAQGLGATHLATGHYARIDRQDDGRYLLRRGADHDKDQSYFLFALTQAQLARALFPVGTLTKSEVRTHARRIGLGVAQKPDSQEICFVPDGDYAAFIEQERPDIARTGTLVDEAGHTIGTHGGVHRFTVGQRKGLGISAPQPLYVLRIEADAGRITVGPRSALGKTQFTVSSANWISGAPPVSWQRATVQVRHRHRPAPGRVRALEGFRAEFQFSQPEPAVAPGQAAVFYDDDLVLGGGWID